MPRTIAIVVILIILLAGGWYIYSGTRPSKQQIEDQKTKVLVVPKDILSDSIVSQLKSFKQNGTLPIIVSPDEKGRDNPFAVF